MAKSSNPSVKEIKSNDYTKVTFSPDLSKFRMTCLDKDIVDLMSRRAFDVAASTRGVKVYLNGKMLPVSDTFLHFYIRFEYLLVILIIHLFIAGKNLSRLCSPLYQRKGR